MLRNLLFKLRLCKGTLIRCPYGVITCRASFPPSMFVKTYIIELNLDHHAAAWLLDECNGAWGIRLLKPKYYRRYAIAFAHAADALSFRIIVADNA